MAKQPKGELVPVVVEFNYDVLDPKVAEQVRSSTARIRERVKKTVEDIIEVGKDLLAVKETLEHGHFLKWLRAEFGWSERTAYNFISVAERFKVANFASLPIQPSAAYLLAAPSVPDEAREVAIDKAKAGEEITVSAAKEIVAETRKKKRPRRQRTVPAEKLGLRLVKVLERYKERWNPKELADLARHLREFADTLDKPERGGKKKAKE
jgi:hypothetical protein